MKNILLITLLIYSYNNVFSQQKLDNAIMLCQYSFTDKRNVNKIVVDTMNLEIGKKVRKFYSYNNYIVDSLAKIDRSKLLMLKRTKNKFNIYFNYPEGKITVDDKITGVLYAVEYVEDISVPQWKITKETEIIFNYICQKATCKFKGRNYVAWYTPTIPISAGPYKFSGLPGLILKITDTENIFDFECIGMCKTNKSIVKNIIDSKKYPMQKISKKDHYFIEKRFYENPFEVMREMHLQIGAKLPPTYEGIEKKYEGKKLPYNPIELEE